MAKVKFVKEKITINTNSCINLRKLAKSNGVQLYSGIHKIANCHGMGLCGTCAVEVPEGDMLSPMKRGEKKVLEKKGLDGSNHRLACQCLVYKNVEVTTLSD